MRSLSFPFLFIIISCFCALLYTYFCYNIRVTNELEMTQSMLSNWDVHGTYIIEAETHFENVHFVIQRFPLQLLTICKYCNERKNPFWLWLLGSRRGQKIWSHDTNYECWWIKNRCFEFGFSLVWWFLQKQQMTSTTQTLDTVTSHFQSWT